MDFLQNGRITPNDIDNLLDEIQENKNKMNNDSETQPQNEEKEMIRKGEMTGIEEESKRKEIEEIYLQKRIEEEIKRKEEERIQWELQEACYEPSDIAVTYNISNIEQHHLLLPQGYLRETIGKMKLYLSVSQDII